MIKVQKRITKQSKCRLLVFGTATAILIIYSVVTFASYILNIKNLKEQQLGLQNKLTSMQEEESLLKTEIEKLNDKDYLARFAREKYLYTKDGEYVLKIDDEEETQIVEEPFIIEDQYIALFGLVTFGIITFIIYKIRKSNKNIIIETNKKLERRI